MSLRLEHRGHQERGGGPVLSLHLQGGLDERPHPARKGGLALREFHARGDHQGVGQVDHFLIQHSLAGEVVIDGWSGQVGADGDRLEGGSVIPQFAEHLTGCAQDALTRFRRLCCGGDPDPDWLYAAPSIVPHEWPVFDGSRHLFADYTFLIPADRIAASVTLVAVDISHMRRLLAGPELVFFAPISGVPADWIRRLCQFSVQNSA